MRSDAIARLRDYMSEQEYAAIIIPSSDSHFSEWIQERYKIITYLTGFTGEAGTLVVTADRAALWTDSRFFISATRELEGSGVELMKIGMEGTPSIVDFLKSSLCDEDIVAMDEELFTYSQYQEYVDALSPITPTLIEDPFDAIWPDRPTLEFRQIRLMDESVSGESLKSKVARLRERIGSGQPAAYIISTLDDIAWLCNLRGSDIEYNPLFMAYAVVLDDSFHLFVSKEKLSPEAMSYLCANEVTISEYEKFDSFLKRLDPRCVRIFAADKVSSKHFFSLYRRDPELGGTVQRMKAVKNRVETEGFRRANAEDAKALSKLFSWIRESIAAGAAITEWDVVEKLISFRQECPDYIGESFPPIVAYGANAALPHYCTLPESAAPVKAEGFLLIDSGGHYTYGTTDTTRTLVLGPVSDEMRDDYTRVLKGMISLACAVFPVGTRGCQLDILARGPVMAGGKMYRHGTGHGIGHQLCVHEGPASIRMEENPVPVEAGMVLSDEPAVYVEGKYGIRHENTLLCVPAFANEHGSFLKFETLNCIGIETGAVNFDLLTESEKHWLEEFNSRCVAPYQHRLEIHF